MRHSTSRGGHHHRWVLAGAKAAAAGGLAALLCGDHWQGFAAPVSERVPPAWSRSKVQSFARPDPRQRAARVTAGAEGEVAAPKKEVASKAAMLKFALPALGIYVADPIMGNIDNGFVGHFGGTVALAALGPGNTLANNLLFLFSSVLNSATTGLVARAWADKENGPEKARKELATTLSFALAAGLFLTLFYMAFAPQALRLLGSPEVVLKPAVEYVRIRGLVCWATLAQSVCLSAILVTRDAVTPLGVVLFAALMNFSMDYLFCAWPFQTGIAGAAWATAISTLAGFSLMLRALYKKQLLPKLQWPSLRQAGPVLEYAGPMTVITFARVVGFTAMGITAASLGTRELAAFQIIVSVFVFFAYAGAPLNQTAQSLLPPLLDAGDTEGVRKTGANIFGIACIVAAVSAGLCLTLLRYAGGIFSSDPQVISLVVGSCLATFVMTGSTLVCSSVDGALLAAKDFSFVVPHQVAVCVLQVVLLAKVKELGLGLPWVLMTFAVRLWAFLLGAVIRVRLGYGPLGRVLMGKAKVPQMS